jgi:anti-sigma regulatory factor (Ser/Thr protein kinase)
VPIRRFAPELESPAEARRFLREAMADLGDVDLDTAELLLSELATNAVNHARTPFDVHVTAVPTVRVAVHDDDQRMPTVSPSPIVEGDHGRGLALVHDLAVRWGVTFERGGKTVWFEL